MDQYSRKSDHRLVPADKRPWKNDVYRYFIQAYSAFKKPCIIIILPKHRNSFFISRKFINFLWIFLLTYLKKPVENLIAIVFLSLLSYYYFFHDEKNKSW